MQDELWRASTCPPSYKNNMLKVVNGMKPKKHLGFNGMRTMLSSCFNQIPEHRQSNKITYSAHDALKSGLACMHFQDPSLLQFQKRLEKKHHKSNLQTLFDIKSIPESTQLRTIIDGVDSDYASGYETGYPINARRNP